MPGKVGARARCGAGSHAVKHPVARQPWLLIDPRWTPPALAGCNPDLEAWPLVWGPFPKDAQFQRRLRPLGRPRFRPAGGGRAGESEGALAGSAGRSSVGGSLEARSEQKLQPRVGRVRWPPGNGMDVQTGVAAPAMRSGAIGGVGFQIRRTSTKFQT